MTHAPQHLRLPYPVSANRYWRVFGGRVVSTQQATSYKRMAALAAMSVGVKKASGDVGLTITLHPKTKKDGTASATRLDLDNALKVALDALNGVAYADDKQVVRITASIGEAVFGGGLGVSIESV